jgi:septal ring factor EnvC (AmiA/AmiB activator)
MIEMLRTWLESISFHHHTIINFLPQASRGRKVLADRAKFGISSIFGRCFRCPHRRSGRPSNRASLPWRVCRSAFWVGVGLMVGFGGMATTTLDAQVLHPSPDDEMAAEDHQVAQSSAASEMAADDGQLTQRSAANEMAAEIAARTQQLDEIEGRLVQLQQVLQDREQRRDALYAELERNERDIAALARAGRQLMLLVEEQRTTVSGLEGRLAQTTQALEAARMELAALLRSAYAMGRGNRLRMLLNSEDVTRSGRVFGYYRCIGRERVARINAVQRLAAELTVLRGEAAAEQRRLQRLADRQAQTRARLEQAQTERRSIVTALEATIAEGRTEAASLNANARKLRTLVEQLRLEVQIADEIGLNPVDIAARKGKLAWPIDNARLSSRFRQKDSDNDLHRDGVLLAADEGSEVHAVHHGRVVYADWLRGFGLLLVIDHGDGYMTLYGHNQTLLKEVGEWIDTGRPSRSPAQAAAVPAAGYTSPFVIRASRWTQSAGVVRSADETAISPTDGSMLQAGCRVEFTNDARSRRLARCHCIRASSYPRKQDRSFQQPLSTPDVEIRCQTRCQRPR